MPAWLIKILGAVYSRIPAALRPPLRRAFLWGYIRLEGLLTRRRVARGERVEFLDFEIAHLERYEFLGPGDTQVLVRSHSSCVSPGTERAVLCGLPGARRPFPYAPGYSTVGLVVAAGKKSGFRPGERVAGRMPHASLGVMSAGSIFKVPDGVSDEDASFIELGIICLQGVRKAAIRPGERVAVVGQGLIGQLAARLARLAGAGEIIAIASSRRRMETALREGADSFVALSDGEHHLDRVQADVVIEAVGSAPAIGLAMRAAAPGARVILLGSSRDLGRGLDWWTMAQARDLTLVGAHISAVPQREHARRMWTYEQEGRLFLDLLARRELNMKSLITWRARPQDCNRVYEVLAGGGAEHVGIVFDWAGATA